MWRSWRFKKIADDKIGLLTDQDFDTEIDECTSDYPETTENRGNSFHLAVQVASNCHELATNERLVQCDHEEILEGREMLSLRCNDKILITIEMIAKVVKQGQKA